MYFSHNTTCDNMVNVYLGDEKVPHKRMNLILSSHEICSF